MTLKETLVTSADGTEYTFVYTGEMPDAVIKEVEKMSDEEIEKTLKAANFKYSRTQ